MRAAWRCSTLAPIGRFPCRRPRRHRRRALTCEAPWYLGAAQSSPGCPLWIRSAGRTLPERRPTVQQAPARRLLGSQRARARGRTARFESVDVDARVRERPAACRAARESRDEETSCGISAVLSSLRLLV